MWETTAYLPLVIFFVSIATIWYGTGIVLKAITSLASTLKISAFTISFFVLGIMTSLPEFTIGITAVSRGESEIMVGNLIGATLVIFLLVIPLLAILGGKVKLPKVLHRPQLILALVTILAPTVMIADQVLTVTEGLIIIGLYLALFVSLSRSESFYSKIKASLKARTKSQHRLLKIIFGVALIFISAQGIVNSAEYFAHALGWSHFVVGLLIIALGTNIPELSLVFRTVLSRKTEIALADYVGSASANALLIGIFIVGTGSPIYLPNHTFVRLTILVTSLILFYIFVRSQNSLSRREGVVLLLLYLIFFALEVAQA